MATNYFEVIHKFISTAVKKINGRVKINNDSIENLCKTLCADFCIIDPYRNKQNKLETDEERDKFCREFNWFYNQLFFISIHSDQER